ncbi:ATP-grasp domain-containing protein [Streptomyces sp. NPDC032161]|uniref:ATP-grasp domain-containing protein n=1 Tax=unclassified Streptomyces TaxID=2593676 RepID=UPI0033C8CE95
MAPAADQGFDDIQYLLVGYSADLLADLDGLLPERSVAVIETPEVIEARGVRERIGAVRCLADVIAAPTQDEANAARLVSEIPRPARIRAVVPAGDYGVVAAAALAAAWGLPGAGPDAAPVFRDKALLRRTAGTAGIAQPEWRVVTGPEEVAEFRAGGDGSCVLKPTNRQASVGVQILPPDADTATAWALTAGAEEQMFRPGESGGSRYLAERLLRGPEVSAEVLVRDGEITFFNSTTKDVLPGRHPVEMGHVVPGQESDEVAARLAAGMRALVEAAKFSTGVLHGEWIVVDGVPHLVECAARLPGDYIVELVEMAYDWSLLRGFLAVLEGRHADPAPPAVRGAAIRYLSAEPGEVREVRGAERAGAVDGVREVLVRVRGGDTVETVTSSWKRPGHVIATGADGPAAVGAAERARAALTIETHRPG